MSAIRWLLLRLRVAYYRRALRDLNPSHPDIPEVVLRLRQLSEQLDTHNVLRPTP